MESAIYIVATPIGNLGDITLRALDVLRQVDVIAAEDTRHTRKLLEHHGIDTRMLSLHEHNEVERSESVIDNVLSGGSIALVSDAGTPLISDPGHTLVRKAKLKGVRVTPVPGPSALTAALSVGGVACGRFVFEGFLPAKNKAKLDILQSYYMERKTIVFYESPHRILDTLDVMEEVFGDRQISVARELTKRFETVHKDSLPKVIEWMRADHNQQKGEFVLILSGNDDKEERTDEEKMQLLVRLLKDLPPKKASAIVSDLLGGSKKEIYNMALSMKEG